MPDLEHLRPQVFPRGKQRPFGLLVGVGHEEERDIPPGDLEHQGIGVQIPAPLRARPKNAEPHPVEHELLRRFQGPVARITAQQGGVPAIKRLVREGTAVVVEAVNPKDPQEEEDSAGVVGMGVGDDEPGKALHPPSRQEAGHPIAGDQVSGVEEETLSVRGLEIDRFSLAHVQEVDLQLFGLDRKGGQEKEKNEPNQTPPPPLTVFRKMSRRSKTLSGKKYWKTSSPTPARKTKSMAFHGDRKHRAARKPRTAYSKRWTFSSG